MGKKIFLTGLLFLSTLIFGEEIFLKENKFFTKDKNNQEILYSGKKRIDKKDFYEERIYKHGILIEEKLYDSKGNLLEHKINDGKVSTYIKNGRKEICIYSNDYKSLKQEIYLDDGTLLTRSFGEKKNGTNSYTYTRTENYSNDGTLSKVYSLIDGDFVQTYGDNPYDGKLDYKDRILTSEKDFKSILFTQTTNFEERGTREYPEVRVEIWLFGILFHKNLEDENYLEFLDDFMKIKKIKEAGKERWSYPNYKLKTYAEDYTIKRRYDESGKVVYDIDKNINDREYLKLSNSGKDYKVYFPNGKLAYKKEKKPIKEEFLKQFEDSYIEEIFYDEKGNEIYYCEDYRNQPQKLSNPGEEQSRFKPKNFLIRKIRRYGKAGKLIYNEDFKIEDDKFIFNVNSYDEKTSAPLYKMEKRFIL